MPIELDPTDPVFTIGVAAKLTRLSHKQLRVLEAKEIVTPARSDHQHRLYSLDQLNLLRYVSYLVGARKVNAAGVRLVLELLERMPEGERLRVLEEADKVVPEGADLGPILDAESPDVSSEAVEGRGEAPQVDGEAPTPDTSE